MWVSAKAKVDAPLNANSAHVTSSIVVGYHISNRAPAFCPGKGCGPIDLVEAFRLCLFPLPPFFVPLLVLCHRVALDVQTTVVSLTQDESHPDGQNSAAKIIRTNNFRMCAGVMYIK